LDLLLQTNYLDIAREIEDTSVQKKIFFKDLIASLYADWLEQGNELLTYGSIPVELELLVVNWMLQDMINDNIIMSVKYVEQTYKNSIPKKLRVQMSTSGSPNSFACVWTTLNAMGAQDKKQYVYMDPSTKEAIVQTIATPYINIAIGQCAVTNNG